MKKRKTYEVSVINKTYSKTYSDETKFYTSDTALELNFQLKEVEYDFDSAEIILLNVDDRSLVTRPVSKNAEGFTYELEEDITARFGEWKGQLKFNEGGEIYVSSPVVFRIENDLNNDRPPQLTDIRDWETLRQSAKDLIVEMGDAVVNEAARVEAENIRVSGYQEIRNIVDNFEIGENSVGTENIKDSAVSTDKTSFITKTITSENIVDSSKSKIGITLNTNTGEEMANELYNTTDFIKVEQGKTYYTPYTTNFYKFSENKDYLVWTQTASYTAEQNGYIRVRISAGSSVPFRINVGSLKPFDEYRELLEIQNLTLDDEKIKSATFTNDELNEGLKVTEKNVNFFYRNSPNLFNKDTVTLDKRLSSANAISDDVNNTVSDYIEVLPNTTYSVTEGSYTHFYDADKTFISGHGVGIKTFTTPENTAYIRITVRKIKLDVFMLVLGNTPPTEVDYIPFNVYSFTDNVQVAREEKRFEGMKLAFNGDSIVQNGSYMLSQIKNELGFESVTNYGIGGTAYAVRTAPWDTNAISLRYGDMADDYDVIAFMAGTNDFKSAEINLDTFKEALHTTFNGLVEKYPTKKLVVFTMPPRYDRTANGETVHQYADAIMEVAGYYSIPSCDLLRNSQLRPWNEINKAEYITDGLHPETPQGYDLMLPRMIEFFKTI